MGLARIAAFETTGNENYKRLAEQGCIGAINAKKQSTNFSLCHGYFSNAEFLLSASNAFNNKLYLEEAEKLADFGINFSDNNNRDWPSGLMGNASSYSFMNGDAGIGNFYLRMACGETIPSGLMIEELTK